MNTKPNIPGEIDPRTKGFSIWAQWRLNHWAYVAILLSVAGDLLVHCHRGVNEWQVALKIFIALLPMLPALLWLRSFRRWLGGMDELDRRITLQVCLFSVSATFYLALALQLLRKWGVVPSESWLLVWHSVWFQSVVLSCLYLIGTKIFNRRFQ